MNKSNLGQFYTRKGDYIIGNLKKFIPPWEPIIDPFAGEWDLLNLFDNPKEAFDIEPKNSYTIQRDVLLNPIKLTKKWVITNPPYLAKNKSKDKTLYNLYNTDDLYKASLISIMGCKGGIIIIPLNFFSSEDNNIREQFLSKYKIKKVNIFEEPVFSNTTYTVCSFYFEKEDNTEQTIDFTFFPSEKQRQFTLKKEQGYQIGHDIFNLEQSHVKVKRLLENKTPNSYLFLRAIDTGNDNGKISLTIQEPYYGKKTDRVFATIVFNIDIPLYEQKFIAEEFNKRIQEYRKEYNSLLFSNYRDKNRKRISFSFAYQLISNILIDLGY